MSQESVLFETTDGIARITLNRPEVLNSFNIPMFERLIGILDQVAQDRGVRAVYLTGAGRGFCAGQDIGGGEDPGPYGDHLRKTWNRLVTAIRALDRPVVCAVNGVAAGAGANVALAADFVVAAEEASFIQAFINIGLIPDCGGTYILPRLAGQARATAMAMLGEKIPARRAYEWGMIHQVCPLASLEQEAWALAARLASLPTFALGLTKRLLNASSTNSLERQLELEAEAQTQAGFSEDHREGVAGFREKRKPVFKGR
jgi:2-(1,2-epoxy-1,2-dihydrophenyl)acetyl-CoA isomerase